MIIALVLLSAGIAVGYLRHGSIRNLVDLQLRWSWLVLVGLALQVGGDMVSVFVYPRLRDSPLAIIILALSYGALVTFVFLNRKGLGTTLIAAGLISNVVVIIANRGMPVSLRATRTAGIDIKDYLSTALKHRVMGPGTRLRFLGDIIGVPLVRNVVSIGDLVLGAGLFLLVVSAMQPRDIAPAIIGEDVQTG